MLLQHHNESQNKMDSLSSLWILHHRLQCIIRQVKCKIALLRRFKISNRKVRRSEQIGKICEKQRLEFDRTFKDLDNAKNKLEELENMYKKSIESAIDKNSNKNPNFDKKMSKKKIIDFQKVILLLFI